MNLEIREIKREDEQKLLEMLEEYENSKLVEGIDRYEGIRNFEDLKNMSFLEWLEDLENKKDEEKLPKEFSPQTTYILIDENNQIIGMVNIRWKEVPVLMSYGGMIGYSIRPSKRGQGYASEMLRLALEILFKTSKKQKILITCKDFNIASKKVIEKNNGIYENTIYDCDDGYNHLIYWIYNAP